MGGHTQDEDICEYINTQIIIARKMILILKKKLEFAL